MHSFHNSRRLLSNRALQTGVFFRLLPYQILLIVISAVNGIVDSPTVILSILSII